MVITDPKGHDFEKYAGTTLIKPNQSEAYAAAGLGPDASLDCVAKKILEKTRAQTLMITRSEAGIALFCADGSRSDFPVHVKEVKDVTGAGDTVLAMLTHALANGIAFDQAAELCNVAAGIAIEHIGCARISLADLAHRLLQLHQSQKIFGDEHMFVLQQVLRTVPFRLVVVTALHEISMALFQSIKEIVNRAGESMNLVVYVTDPAPSEDCLELLASLSEIDFIILHSPNVIEACKELAPSASYLFENGMLERLDSFNLAAFETAPPNP
jgi:D-beta-D-heptose 7-phosphate kinase/D-beta-D-heptose 1-phosphate adenosyltransferase